MLLCINSISCISYIKIYSSILQFIFSFKISCFFSRTCTFMFHYIKLTSSFSSYIYFLKFLVVYLSFLFFDFFSLHLSCFNFMYLLFYLTLFFSKLSWYSMGVVFRTIFVGIKELVTIVVKK